MTTLLGAPVKSNATPCKSSAMNSTFKKMMMFIYREALIQFHLKLSGSVYLMLKESVRHSRDSINSTTMFVNITFVNPHERIIIYVKRLI